jgi:hypothetical protein
MKRVATTSRSLKRRVSMLRPAFAILERVMPEPRAPLRHVGLLASVMH